MQTVFFPYYINHWKTVDSGIKSSMSIQAFKIKINERIRPDPSFCCTRNKHGMSRLTQINFSDIRDHRFNNKFNCQSLALRLNQTVCELLGATLFVFVQVYSVFLYFFFFTCERAIGPGGILLDANTRPQINHFFCIFLQFILAIQKRNLAYICFIFSFCASFVTLPQRLTSKAKNHDSLICMGRPNGTVIYDWTCIVKSRRQT